MYRDARTQSGISRDEASFKLHVAPRTLANYETGETEPPPEVVLAMAQVYRQPEMTQVYCKQNCAIGKVYSYEILNAIDTSLPAVILKLAVELEEARTVFNRLMVLTVNKQKREDFSSAEWIEFSQIVQEFLDVEHNVEVLKLAIGRIVDVAEFVEAHNKKCREHGYTKEKVAL